MKNGKFKKITAICLALTMLVGLFFSNGNIFKNVVNAAVKNRVTLSWGNNRNITLLYIDKDGNPIQAPTLNNGERNFDLGDSAKINSGNYINVSNYTFVGAFTNTNQTDSKFAIERVRVRRQHNNIQYQYKYVNYEDYSDFRNQSKTVYMIFENNEANQLHEVETVDSSQYVDIDMFQYQHSGTDYRYIGGQYNNAHDATQGLLQNKLNSAGLPVISSGDYRGQTLSYFDVNSRLRTIKNTWSNLNHIFLKSTYDSTGYYEYSSFDNYATLNQDSGNFTVYEELGTPKNDNALYYQRGNFFPLDSINANKKSTNTNQYNEYGSVLDNNDPRKGEALYLVDSPTYHFGMRLSTNFVQLKDGEVTNPTTNQKEDMIYEFNGDDDLWVYIDDVLVLDVGGVHDARTGTINFSTGSVQVQNEENTTIKAMFRSAGVFPDGTAWDESKVDQYFKGETFADYSSHSMKMFYMERGEGASNLKMKFNLPVVPKGEIQIGKQLSANTDPSINAGDTKFQFQLYLRNDDGTETLVSKDYYESTIKGDSYVKDGFEGAYKEEIEWSEDGQSFWLNPGEVAVFPNFNEDDVYFVREIGVKSDLYDNVSISGVEVTYSNNPDGTLTYTSKDMVVGERAAITYINNINVNNLNYLEIMKRLDSGQNSTDEYQVQVKLDGEVYTGDYYVFDSISDTTTIDNATKLTATNGTIKLKQNQVVRIYSILSGVKFEVNEINLDESRYFDPTYQVSENERKDYKTGNSGEILLDPDGASVIVTNKLQTGKLQIVKTIDKAIFEHGDPIFTFEIKDSNGNTYVKNVRFTSDDIANTDGKYTKATAILELPFGEYEITELDTIRYEVVGEKVKKVELENNGLKQVKFENKLDNSTNYSHTDLMENRFTINADGSVSVTPVEQETVEEGE